MKKSMSRRRFIQQLGFSGAALILPGCNRNYMKTSQLALDKPNVLFIIADDLRPDLGCYGNKTIKSPNIDKLASMGTVFKRAYCQIAICNPSRISFLSGHRPDTTGVHDNVRFLRDNMPDVVTLPQLFKNHGYTTLSIGKIFHHDKGKGSDLVAWSEPPYGLCWKQWFTKESGDLLKRLKQLPKNQRGKAFRGPPYEASDHPDADYPDGKTADKAIETLRRVKDQPFFLGVGFIKPHLPFNCPKKYWDMYPEDTIKLPDNYYHPENVPAVALHSNYELRFYGGMPAEGDVSEEQALNLIRSYRACVSFLDAQVGRVLNELDRLGLREKTIVVLLGDHGYHLGENRLWTKMTNFEITTRSPLIVSAPGAKAAGKTCNALVEFVDVYPTLAELSRLPMPGTLEGLSMAPLLDNPKLPWKQAAFSQYPRGKRYRYEPERGDAMGRSIRTDRYRYTEWTEPDGKLVGVELYDQKKDPQNNVNVAGKPQNKELAKKLSKQLQEGWRAALPSDFDAP
ncbi:MAG: sulfatase [Planctomycetota bacterium]|jgi:arylsulfatase A-like enzyme